MSEKKWYVYIDSTHAGPFSWSEVMEMHNSNAIDEESLVWQEGQDDWLPLGEMDPAFKARPAHVAADDLPPDLPPDLPAHMLGEVNANAVESLPPEVNFEEEVESILEGSFPSELESPPGLPATPPVEQQSIPAVNENEYEDLDEDEKQFLDAWKPSEADVVESAVEDQKLEELTQEFRKDTEQAYDVPPPLEEDIHVNSVENSLDAETVELPPLAEEDTGESFHHVSEYDEEKVQTLSRRKKYILSGIVAVIVLIMISQFSSDKKMIPSLKALKTAEARKLMKAVNSELDIRVEVSPSEDGKEIWFASNQKGPGIFHVKLTSVPGRVLSEEEIEVVGKTDFNNYVGVFRYLKLRKGLKVVPGEYKLEGKIILTGRKARLINYAKDNALLSSLVGKAQTTFKIEKDIRISKFSGEQFENQLTEYRNSRKLEKVRPLMERIQKFRTLITLAEEVIELYSNELAKIQTGKDIKGFELEYAKTVSPVLQGLILENHRKSMSLPDKNSEEYADYANLLTFGRQLGEIVSDMVTRTNVKPKITDKGRKGLVSNFSGEINKLIKHGRDYMNSIQRRIEKMD